MAKILPCDIRNLLNLLPRLEEESAGAQRLLVERRADTFATDCLPASWCHLYEYPFPEHVARIAVAFDAADVIKECATAERPVLAASAYIQSLDEDESELTPEEKEDIRLSQGLAFGLLTSLLKSLQCLMAYGAYLNDLVAQVRQGTPKGDSALLKAVRIDPTAIGTPSINARMSRAVLEGDKKFLDAIKRAINAPLLKQHQANTDKIRFVLQVLHESKVEQLNDDELHDLFVQQLALYSAPSKADAGDAAKGIRAIASRMKKAKAST